MGVTMAANAPLDGLPEGEGTAAGVAEAAAELLKYSGGVGRYVCHVFSRYNVNEMGGVGRILCLLQSLELCKHAVPHPFSFDTCTPRYLEVGGGELREHSLLQHEARTGGLSDRDLLRHAHHQFLFVSFGVVCGLGGRGARNGCAIDT